MQAYSDVILNAGTICVQITLDFSLYMHHIHSDVKFDACNMGLNPHIYSDSGPQFHFCWLFDGYTYIVIQDITVFTVTGEQGQRKEHTAIAAWADAPIVAGSFSLYLDLMWGSRCDFLQYFLFASLAC